MTGVDRTAAVGDPVPLLYALPHSGRDYPDDFGSCQPLHILRRAEDAYVDQLLDGLGVEMVTARFPRAYLDVNRTIDDLDPQLFATGAPATAGPKSRLGIGLIRRVVTPEFPIYDRLLSLSEVEDRIARCYVPYHQELARILAGWSGRRVMIDWHSMKSVGNAATPDGARPRPDFVIGDFHGKSCDGALTRLVEQSLTALGYSVTVNDPYAGGATLQRYGDPKAQLHALQIEINRALYLDELKVEPTNGFRVLRASLAELTEKIKDWVREDT